SARAIAIAAARGGAGSSRALEGGAQVSVDHDGERVANLHVELARRLAAERADQRVLGERVAVGGRDRGEQGQLDLADQRGARLRVEGARDLAGDRREAAVVKAERGGRGGALAREEPAHQPQV